MSVHVEWISDPECFAELADEWAAILPADSRPFDLHCWYAAWWKAFGAGAELAVCTLRRDQELAGAFPLLRQGFHRALANAHTPSFRPLARDAEAMRELIAATLERAGSRLELIAIPAHDPSVESLGAGARAASLLTHIEPSYASPFVEIKGDFEDWRTATKRRWGAPLERLRRKMAREYEAESRLVVQPDDLAAELEDGFRVEGSGWKGRAGTAINSQPETESFYRMVAESFAARDELRLSRLALDGRTVAFDLCVLRDRRLYLLKTGFDEDYRRLAPGLVMRLETIRKCFEDGLRSHELLGVETGWKAKFASGSRPHVSLRTYRRSPVGLTGYAYRKGLRPHLRRAYRRLARHG